MKTDAAPGKQHTQDNPQAVHRNCGKAVGVRFLASPLSPHRLRKSTGQSAKRQGPCGLQRAHLRIRAWSALLTVEVKFFSMNDARRCALAIAHLH